MMHALGSMEIMLGIRFNLQNIGKLWVDWITYILCMMRHFCQSFYLCKCIEGLDHQINSSLLWNAHIKLWMVLDLYWKGNHWDLNIYFLGHDHFQHAMRQLVGEFIRQANVHSVSSWDICLSNIQHLTQYYGIDQVSTHKQKRCD